MVVLTDITNVEMENYSFEISYEVAYIVVQRLRIDIRRILV